MPRVHVLLNMAFYARQPIHHRMGRGQGNRGVVGEDAPTLGSVTRWQVVVVAGADQLRAGLGAHDNPAGVDRHTAGQQIRVSEVGQEGEAHAGRQIERGEEVVPEQVVVVSRVTGGAELKTGPGRLCRLADEVAVAADVDKERTGFPPIHSSAGGVQKGQHQRTIQLAVQREDAVGGKAAGQQGLGHGPQVVVHGGFAGWGRAEKQRNRNY